MAETCKVPMHLIIPPDIAMRSQMDDGELRQLAESMTLVGLLQPIGLKPVEDKLEIVWGHRRYEGARINNWYEIEAKVGAPGEEMDEAMMLAENLHRENVSDGDVALWLMQIQEKRHLTEAQLCALVKRSPDWIGDRLRLAAGDPDVFQALIRKDITFSVARELNKIKRNDYRRMHLAQAIESTPPARIVANWVRDANLQADAATAVSVPEQPAAVGVAPSIIPPGCVICGGNLDPYNMEWVLVHKGELQRLQAIIKQYSEGG